MKLKVVLKNAGTPSGRIGFLVPWPPLFCSFSIDFADGHGIKSVSVSAAARIFWIPQPTLFYHACSVVNDGCNQSGIESDLLSRCESRGIKQSY
jgi:hypothetical protein